LTKNIITIQHTEAEHHTNGMIGGNTDWPLTEKGKIQAHNIGKKLLNELDLDKKWILYSSDMTRTTETAKIVADYLNMDINYRTELREISVGDGKGTSKEWFNNNKIQENKNVSGIDYRPFNNAESKRDVWLRLEPFINEIESNIYENIIIIAHGGSIQLFTLQWLKIAIEQIEALTFWGNAGGISKMHHTETKERVLDVWNDRSYIK
jgi:probable phosphoglycerate mutase